MTETTTTTEVEIDEAVRALLNTRQERLTIVHCSYFIDAPTHIRIWPESCLVEAGGTKRALLQAFGIALAPARMPCFFMNQYARFTLVFEGLGKGCSSFHLDEDIPEPGGFYSDPVPRNETDIYKVLLKSKPYRIGYSKPPDFGT